MTRFTKGRKYMSLVQYNVFLEERDEKDVLVFGVDQENYPEGLVVNLNEATGQNDFMNVFAVVLKMLEKEEIEFRLKIAEGYSKVLFKDVCKEYVESLNAELRNMHAKIHDELQV